MKCSALLFFAFIGITASKKQNTKGGHNLPSIPKRCNASGQLGLIIDSLPKDNSVLASLTKAKANALFVVPKANVTSDNADLFNAAIAKGHEIGFLATANLGKSRLTSEFEEVKKTFAEMNISLKYVMYPKLRSANAAVLAQLANDAGLTAVSYNLDLSKKTSNVKKLVSKRVKNARKNSFIAFVSGKSKLSDAIKYYKARNFNLVKMCDCLNPTALPSTENESNEESSSKDKKKKKSNKKAVKLYVNPMMIKGVKKELKKLQENDDSQSSQNLGTGMAQSNTPSADPAAATDAPKPGTPEEGSGWSFGIIIAILAVIVIAGFLVYFYRTQYHRKS